MAIIVYICTVQLLITFKPFGIMMTLITPIFRNEAFSDKSVTIYLVSVSSHPSAAPLQLAFDDETDAVKFCRDIQAKQNTSHPSGE